MEALSLATESFPVIITPRGLEAVRRFRPENIAYLRELPRLLEEGEAGRHALVKGNDVVGIWDTDGDALQAGYERFGDEQVFIKKIDSRDLERLPVWEKYLEETACSSEATTTME
jgi:hypothetical protein